jgi:two-component system response regulator AtoC
MKRSRLAFTIKLYLGDPRARSTCRKASSWSRTMPTELKQNYRIDPADLPGEAVIFGSTAAMREIRSVIDCVLSSDLPVLIQGESGTGKEVIARFLHSRSNRREAPFVRMSCAAVPANLLESELFGREKGACAGVNEDRQGLIEVADGGTLFLDEIGDLPWEMQGKLIQLLRDGTYTRAGGNQQLRGNTRIICAANNDLYGAVEAGSFREDLFRRIDVVSLRLSALRERKSDIPQLCEYLLEKLARRFGRNAPQLNPGTIQLLKQWDWPGNLRELENWVARVIVLGYEVALESDFRRQAAATNESDNRQLRFDAMNGVARRVRPVVSSTLILKVLQTNRWNRKRTADELRMSYRSLLYRLREAGMPRRRISHRGFPPAH